MSKLVEGVKDRMVAAEQNLWGFQAAVLAGPSVLGTFEPAARAGHSVCEK